MQYDIYYKSEIISVSTPNVDPEGCTSITFENLGTDDATINQAIPLLASDAPREFNNLPYVKIKSMFQLTFSGVGTQKVLVTRGFTKQVK